MATKKTVAKKATVKKTTVKKESAPKIPASKIQKPKPISIKEIKEKISEVQKMIESKSKMLSGEKVFYQKAMLDRALIVIGQAYQSINKIR